MNKLIKVMALLLGIAFAIPGYAQVQDVFSQSATGTTSATVFVEGGGGFGEITDLSYRLDSNVTSGFVAIRSGQTKYPITSATSATGSVLWFSNTGTGVAQNDYIVFFDQSEGQYYLRRVTAATTTSVTLLTSLAPATTTSDYVWSLRDPVEKAVAPGLTSGQSTVTSIWLPRNVPSAITLDGNTTSCRISVSGTWSSNK